MGWCQEILHALDGSHKNLQLLQTASSSALCTSSIVKDFIFVFENDAITFLCVAMILQVNAPVLILFSHTRLQKKRLEIRMYSRSFAVYVLG
jgi:hypothetical protein